MITERFDNYTATTATTSTTSTCMYRICFLQYKIIDHICISLYCLATTTATTTTPFNSCESLIEMFL